jgi:hypothetical protein
MCSRSNIPAMPPSPADREGKGCSLRNFWSQLRKIVVKTIKTVPENTCQGKNFGGNTHAQKSEKGINGSKIAVPPKMRNSQNAAVDPNVPMRLSD